MIDSSFEFERTTPEEIGVPSEAILDMIDRAKEENIELHSFMLIRHGKVAAELWWKPYDREIPHHMYSFSKSITSTAVAFAISEGRLSLDDTVVSFFPNRAVHASDSGINKMTIRHLITMTSGSNADEVNTIRQLDWIDFFLKSKLNSPPGARFHYNSINSYMLSAILRKVTGCGLVEYLMPRLFEPLGIKEPKWDKCPMGIETGGWGLHLKTEEMARFMYLYQQHGMWQGRQLLPKGWAEEATVYITDMKDFGEYTNEYEKEFGYGMHFWGAKNGMYRADGMLGQYGFVWPEKDLIIITTGGQIIQREVLYLIYETIFHAVDTVPEGTRSGLDYELLCRLKRRLKLYSTLPSRRYSETENKIENVKYNFSMNFAGILPIVIRYMENLSFNGIEWVKFNFGSNACRMRWKEDVKTNQLIIPLDGSVAEGVIAVDKKQYRVVANGKWINENTLKICVWPIEKPHRREAVFTFDGDRVTVFFEEHPTVQDSFKYLLGMVVSANRITTPASKLIRKIVDQNISGTST